MFIKFFFFNNFFINYLNVNFFHYNWSNIFLHYFFIFNCFFYKFYNENMFMYYKLINNNKNHFYWFLVRFFKKRNTKKKRKKLKLKLKKRKKRVFRFRRRRRFWFKRVRKHYKLFKFKKKRKKKDSFIDSNFAFYYNYVFKIVKIKKIKYKKFFKQKHIFLPFESNFLRGSFLKKSWTTKLTHFFNLNIFIKSANLISINITKFIKFYRNLKFIRFNFIVHKHRFIKRNKKYYYNYINNAVINNEVVNKDYYGYFFCILDQIFTFFNYLFFIKFCNFVSYKFLKTIRRKKLRRKKRKKRWHLYRNKFFKKKRKYRYKSRFIFYRKLNMKRNKNTLKKGFYKFLFSRLIKSFKYKHNYFIFSNLSRYNFYFFSHLKQRKGLLKKFFKKNFIFFDTFKKNANKEGLIYNNHTPVYSTIKPVIKKFKKIFKSKFNKKFNNFLYYYVIFFFETLLSRKIMMKSYNLNFFKKPKYKKIFFYKKLIKIFKKNKFLVISRSVKFNLAELLEITLHAFYKKDLYPLINWFIRNFKPIHFTRHKNFLTFFTIVLNDVFESYKDTYRVKGFFFILKGKIGVTSNAKRKTVKFVLGSLNNSNRSKKIDFQQNVVKSLSGSLGISMVLSY